LNQLHLLLQTEVTGLDPEQKIEVIRQLCQVYQAHGDSEPLPTLCIVPFMTGRRPTDEAAHPGLGSSDHASLILDLPQEANRTYMLYALNGLPAGDEKTLSTLAIDITLSFAGPEGNQQNGTIPGWHQRPVEPTVFEVAASGQPVVRPVNLAQVNGRRLVLAISPTEAFLPGQDWQWD